MNAASTAVSRRQFLQASGALVITFTMPSSFVGGQPRQAGAGAASDDQLDSWLAVHPKGGVILFTGKVELGTGVQTALSQIVAEELDVPVADVRLIQGWTGRVPNQGPTVGSKTLQIGAVPIRRAAAAARQALLELASTRLSAPAEQLTVENGVVRVQGSGSAAATVSYAELIGAGPFNRAIPETVTPKSPDRYRIVGKSVPRVELPAKVMGTHGYVHNHRMIDMLHGRIVRPSAIGATLASVDESSVRALPGVVKVVRRGNFVGVVAEREEQAIAAARQLAVTWTPPAAGLPDMNTLDAVIRATPSTERMLKNDGDVAAAMRSAKTRLEATYSLPFQSHASTGPSCAVADVTSDRAMIWSGTQGSYLLREALADLLALPVDRVEVVWTEASGCYGHNGADDAAADAALLSREVGKPVRVQWMRHDEHVWDPKGPAMLMDVRAALGEDGTIAAWDYAVMTPTHLTRPGGTAKNLLAAQLMGAPLELGAGGGDRNARLTYVVPNQHIAVRWLRASVLRPSAFRGLGGPANVFAIESFMDELAAAAGADPVQFRLRHLQDPRAIAVIKRVAELARWQPQTRRTSSTSGIAKGRGVAFLQYENANAYVAAIVDLDVDRQTGHVRVTRVFVSHDCGMIVNPDGVRNQIEGGVIQAISRTLKEQVQWDHHTVTSADWASYPILTFTEVPDTIEIALIDHPDLPALGAGEPAHCAIPAAISNAIFHATGTRLRAIPFTPDRVKAALAHPASAQRRSGARRQMALE